MVKHPRAEMARRTVAIAGETARLRLSSMLIRFTSRQPRRLLAYLIFADAEHVFAPVLILVRSLMLVFL
jgi:hypothetical protein